MVAVQGKIDGESFRETREERCVYVDKTTFAERLLSPVPPKASIILYPHGFGKTLGMSMLHDFCDIRQDSRAIFEGLAISENKEICDKWMNQYPVILLNLKEVKGDNFEETLDKFEDVIKDLFAGYGFLRQNKAAGRGVYPPSETENRPDMRSSMTLWELSRDLHEQYGKRAIVLIDDYDLPLLHAQQKGYYEEMAQFLGSLYGAVMKDNGHLEFGVLTGCLPYTNHSDISGFNNFATYHPSHARYAGKFGFSSEEVEYYLAQEGYPEDKNKIEDLYKGYLVGEALSRARNKAEAAQLKGQYKNVVLWDMGFWRRRSSLRAE